MARGATRSFRGSGRGRSGRPGTRGPCIHFQRGRCSFGASCKFSHDVPPVSDEQQMVHDQYYDWKQDLRLEFLHGAYNRIWQDALKILDVEDRETQQLLAKDLVDEGSRGLDIVRNTLEADHDGIETQLSIATAFLGVITHPGLLDCLSVDPFVGTLYIFVGGSGGDRIMTYLTKLRALLIQANSNGHDRDLEKIFVLMLRALHEFLSREKRALHNEALSPLLDSMDQLVDELQLGEVSRIRIQSMQRMVNIATGLVAVPSQNPLDVNRPVTLPKFPSQIDIPGGRHDNDFEDASMIGILPTKGEITAELSDFLPKTSWLEPHFSPNNQTRYLDAAIRLLRHDLFGALKEDLYRMMSDLEEGVSPSKLLRETQTRAYLYTQVQVSHLLVERRHGLQAQIKFHAPAFIRGKKKGKEPSQKDQARWWRDSPRFAEGALACLVATGQGDRAKEVLFLVVTEKNTELNKDQKSSHLVPEQHGMPSITAKLATRTAHNLQTLVRWHGEGVRAILVDFPALIPATFMPTMENLQKKLRLGELPFGRWIVPPDIATSNQGGDLMSASTAMPPPAYARRPGFTFCLDSIAVDGPTRLSIDPMDPGRADLDLVTERTGLDRGQSEGLVAALTREYALIQGPPGTGKSFLGVKILRVLLAHKVSRSLGPILVICYTNHALDQFLKHLLDSGVDKLIRIGGQSRMTELDSLNLRVVSARQGKTRIEAQQLGKAYSSLEKHMDDAGRYLAPLHRAKRSKPSWAVLDQFLLHKHGNIHSQFSQVDKDGFEQVGQRSFDVWLGKDSPHIDEARTGVAVGNPDLDLQALTALAEQSVHSLLPAQRWVLAQEWMSDMRQGQADRLSQATRRAENEQQALNDVHDEVHRRSLLSAEVIGVTTTGLARHIEMLQRVRCKVVVCEEAGEVMEPHLAASALLPGAEHLIQIGDHRQLRPQIANFDLSMESSTGQSYKLDRSQFERRAEGEPGMPPVAVAQLNVQRRMRPEISALIRDIYPRLEDHEVVKSHPDVVGMASNVFWLDHDHLEDGSNDEGHNTKSHSNEWEVSMTKALVRHLVLQGTYRASDIAVLTPYTGQLQKLRTALADSFEVFLSERDQEALTADGFEASEAVESDRPMEATRVSSKALQKKTLSESLRLATVDNFQGEEAKVVVVSLVRANHKRRVGFLRTENRINVLISRAQHGLFLLGHTATYLNIPMWARIHTQLAKADAVGNALHLTCPRHPDTATMACATPDDFVKYSPEGGCARQCDRRLELCGHRCQAKCHASALHEAFMCPQACPRLRKTCDHACVRLCGEDCGRCMVRLDGVRLPCGHIQDKIACYQLQNLGNVTCRTEVRKKVPGCQDEVTVPCQRDVATESFRCPVRCKGLLECGHPCPGTCGSCRSETIDGAVTLNHQPCKKICQRPYGTCNHRCPKVCHQGENCGSCQQACQVRCPHSACSQRCDEPCVPCIEPCAWSCSHQGACLMPCAAPCERLPCDQRCDRYLNCGHRCPSLCGEQCPEKYCPVCADDGKRGMRVDLLELKTLSEIDVDETPIVVLACGHAFTAESLDGTLGMADVYNTDDAGRFIGLINSTFGGGPMSRVVPACPDCKCPVRQFATRRYNRVVNRAVMDETSRRFLIRGRAKIASLQQASVEIESTLSATFETAVGTFVEVDALSIIYGGAPVENVLRSRYRDIMRLSQDAQNLQRQMEEANQPARKLFEAMMTRRNQIALLELKMENLDISTGEAKCEANVVAPVFDKQVSLGAQLVHIKLQYLILEDRFRLVKKARRALGGNKMTEGTPGPQPSPFLSQCEKFIATAREQTLPRLVLQASLCHARVASWAGVGSVASQGEKAASCRDTAKTLLEEAITMCTHLKDTEDLRTVAGKVLKALLGPHYETVTSDEIAAIKHAMVSGSQGMNTHSGHWYNCENGHPFAIGECGMPMEEARCPECGSSIGGQDHSPVAGVSRATNME